MGMLLRQYHHTEPEAEPTPKTIGDMTKAELTAHTEPEAEPTPKTIGDMTKAELTAHAEAEGIDLAGAKTKADILAAINADPVDQA